MRADFPEGESLLEIAIWDVELRYLKQLGDRILKCLYHLVDISLREHLCFKLCLCKRIYTML